MKLISHRGNINGPNIHQENSPEYINTALEGGYDVEIDIWYAENKWYLGHDIPQYKTTLDYISNPKFWCHAKNEQAFYRLKQIIDINCFWHDKDLYTITSKGYIWCNVGVPLLLNSICVMPEKGINGSLNQCAGICSDYIVEYK